MFYTVEVNEHGTFLRHKGKLHREDGPAIEYANGDKLWWLNDILYSEEEFLRRTQGVEMTLEQIEKAAWA